jgi:hypothetical protein
MYLNFTRAFETAWERMMVILFRPFDLGKWFVIGFSAFLAGLISGGNGVNSSFNVPNSPSKSEGSGTFNAATPQEQFHQFQTYISQLFSGFATGMLIVLVIVIFVAIVAFSLLIFWLGSRGQFMFLDNVVRNRAAIAAPWQYYARQANSFFLVYLLIAFASFLLLLPLLIAGIFLAWPLFQQSRWPDGGEIAGFVVIGLLYLGLSIVITIVLFLFREFSIPIMFRQGVLARPALFAAMKLVAMYPGSLAVFILLRMAIFIGVVVLCVIVCCATCCLALLPYLGTVALLPALVFVRCFTLDCLAQFGPEYDAFTVDAVPGLPPTRPLPP